jgi:cyclase
MNSSRRSVLKFSLLGLAGLAGAARISPLLAQGSAATAVRGAVSVINAGGTNVVVCNTPDGLVLVDSGTPEFSSQLMNSLSAINSRGVNTLFNTHWHDDHCGANEIIGKSGARIIASSKSWHHMATEYYLPHEERWHRALPQAALPTMKFSEKASLQVGDETIAYGPLVEAHTDGDIYVHFRNANVLVDRRQGGFPRYPGGPCG